MQSVSTRLRRRQHTAHSHGTATASVPPNKKPKTRPHTWSWNFGVSRENALSLVRTWSHCCRQYPLPGEISPTSVTGASALITWAPLSEQADRKGLNRTRTRTICYRIKVEGLLHPPPHTHTHTPVCLVIPSPGRCRFRLRRSRPLSLRISLSLSLSLCPPSLFLFLPPSQGRR